MTVRIEPMAKNIITLLTAFLHFGRGLPASLLFPRDPSEQLKRIDIRLGRGDFSRSYPVRLKPPVPISVVNFFVAFAIGTLRFQHEEGSCLKLRWDLEVRDCSSISWAFPRDPSFLRATLLLRRAWIQTHQRPPLYSPFGFPAASFQRR